MIVVLDASALLAIALHEPGGDVVLSRIAAASGGALIHAVNATEVAFKLMIRGIPEGAAWNAATFRGVQSIEECGASFVQAVAGLKTRNHFLSLADCFCIALGKYVGGEVVTSDKGFTRAVTGARIFQFR